MEIYFRLYYKIQLKFFKIHLGQIPLLYRLQQKDGISFKQNVKESILIFEIDALVGCKAKPTKFDSAYMKIFLQLLIG